MGAVWDGQNELRIVAYDPEQFRFKEWFCQLLNCNELESLHVPLAVSAENYRHKVSEFQKHCDQNANSLNEALDRFFRVVVEPVYGATASRQPSPTFRSHFAVPDVALEEESKDFENLGYTGFLQKHYFDNYRPGIFHRDNDYGLLDGTVNAWLPITDVSGTNSLWIGSHKGRGQDASPISLRYGQCLFFDGAYRWHGAVWNTSNVTRVSFDIRFIPVKHLDLVRTVAI